jgi:hypothetical protein
LATVHDLPATGTATTSGLSNARGEASPEILGAR